jgi:hypothetical protein
MVVALNGAARANKQYFDTLAYFSEVTPMSGPASCRFPAARLFSPYIILVET